jgi:hypothetical protein
MKLNKKWLFLFCILFLFLILTAFIYIFIPGEVTVSRRQLVRCNASAAFRTIGDEDLWKKWWPLGGEAVGSGGVPYRLTGHIYPSVGVLLQTNGRAVPGVITVLTVGGSDSLEVLWQCRAEMGWDPFTRVSRYRELRRTGQLLETALSALRQFLFKEENIYGMEVRKVMCRDSVLIGTKVKTDSYPSTAVLYGAIRSIRAYAAGQGAREIDHPMLHVTFDSGRYESQIAIPVDREVKETKRFFIQRFVPWKVLTGQVVGGTATAERAMEQLQSYVADRELTAMALSFQFLVTERDLEPDTARWVTQVVVPVP